MSLLITKNTNSSNAVSRGALLRHRNIEVKGLRTRSQWGICLDEPFEPDLHPDGVLTSVAKGRNRPAKSPKKRSHDECFNSEAPKPQSSKVKGRMQPSRQRKPLNFAAFYSELDDSEESDQDSESGIKSDENIVLYSDLQNGDIVLDRLRWMNKKVNEIQFDPLCATLFGECSVVCVHTLTPVAVTNRAL